MDFFIRSSFSLHKYFSFISLKWEMISLYCEKINMPNASKPGIGFCSNRRYLPKTVVTGFSKSLPVWSGIYLFLCPFFTEENLNQHICMHICFTVTKSFRAENNK